MIIEIKFHNDHPILRGLDLDFRKKDETPYKTIILAGENGCGKTTILQAIDCLRQSQKTKDSNIIERICLSKNGAIRKFQVDSKGIYYLEDTCIVMRDDIEQYIAWSLFMEARSQFTYSHNSQQVDSYNASMRELVRMCIKNQNELARKFFELFPVNECSENNTASDEFINYVGTLQISRFRNAFHTFFLDKKLRFKGLKNENQNNYELIFAKQNDREDKEFSINDLSSGEKQIVFRGTEVLQNKSNMRNGLVLVDEPELSMHPKWQKRILKYYQDLLTDPQTKEQTAQLIVATHSPYIIEEAMKDRDNTLVIMLKEKDGKIEPKYVGGEDCVLPSPTSAEVNYIAFDIPSIDYHQQLYGEVHKKFRKEHKDKDEKKDKINIYKIEFCNKSILEYLGAHKEKYDVDINDLKPGKYCKLSPRGDKTSGEFYKKYEALPTYIRNAIDHPGEPDENPRKSVVDMQDELRTSIELLQEIIAKRRKATDCELGEFSRQV